MKIHDSNCAWPEKRCVCIGITTKPVLGDGRLACTDCGYEMTELPYGAYECCNHACPAKRTQLGRIEAKLDQVIQWQEELRERADKLLEK